MKDSFHCNKFCLAIVGVFLLNNVLSRTNAEIRKGDNSHKADLETLKLVQVVFRHGERTPIHEYPNDPYGNVEQYWPEGLGQLTKKGMMQQFLLGEYLRWRYDGYLSRTYNKSEIFAQSSYLDRTIMSAQANLAGMYPPTPRNQWNPALNWQPIPVHSIPSRYDYILDFAINCQRYVEAFKNVTESESIVRVRLQYEWMFKYLTENTGKDVSTIEHISELYDTFFVQTDNNLVLPAFAKKVFPNPMKSLADLHFEMLEYNDQMIQLRGGPLLNELVWYMDLIRKREEDVHPDEHAFHFKGHLHDHLPPEYRKAKLYMFSGHDSTLSALLITLGVYNYIVPPYASCIIVELHGTKNSPDLDFVKIFYMNNTKEYPYELHVPNCGNPCTLHHLKKLKSHLMIKDWEKQCDSLPSDDISIGDQVTTILFFMGITTVILIVILKMMMGLRRRRIFSVDVSNSKLV